jgi:hypothetical protein
LSFKLSNIKWGWVALGVAIAIVIAFGSSICAVMGYATYLASQVMGTPDQTMINEFAANTAEGVVYTLIGVGTLVGGLVAGRKARVDALQNGLAVGLSTALIGLAAGILGGLDLWTVAGFALSLGGGWVGGQLANKSLERVASH